MYLVRISGSSSTSFRNLGTGNHRITGHASQINVAHPPVIATTSFDKYETLCFATFVCNTTTHARLAQYLISREKGRWENGSFLLADLLLS